MLLDKMFCQKPDTSRIVWQPGNDGNFNYGGLAVNKILRQKRQSSRTKLSKRNCKPYRYVLSCLFESGLEGGRGKL